MAHTTRQRTVVNRGRKRNPPRQLSAKQIKFFGTPQQKAALKRKRSAARPRHSPAARRGTKRRSNPGGDIVGFTLANPAKRKVTKKMATKKRSRTRAKAHAGYRHHTKKNTGGRRRAGHRGRTKRNAGSSGGGISSIGNLVTNAVFVIAGALGSKLITQMVLGTNNSGIMGYAGNAASGGILYFLVDKVMKNRVAANGILAGTAVQIVLRLINDYTPFGQYVSQLGMGDYQAQAFVTPQVLVDPYNRAQIKVPAGWLPPAPPPMAAVPAVAGGMGDLYGGRSELY